MRERRQWLIDKRKERGLEQFEVSQLADITQQYYSYIECGMRRPSPDIAQKLGEILGFDWTLFFLKKED